MDEKREGFGVGELRGVPESAPEDLIDLSRIEDEQQRAWAEHLENCRIHGEGCTVTVGANQRCGKKISARVYYSGTMGSCVMCEEHWIAYWLGYHPDWPATFDGIMERLAERAEAERNRVKHCARCGSTNAAWNSGAGEDLCPDHWDEY